MALRTTSSPYDRLTEAELQNTVAEWSGIAYANLKSAASTELARIIEDTHEYISQRLGHFPWTRREWSTTLTAGSQTLTMPADFRELKIVTETRGGSTSNAEVVTKDEWRQAWGPVPRDTHPWATRGVAAWFFDGMTDDNPPVAQVKRHGTETSNITVVFDYMPYFGLIASDTFAELPPNTVMAIRHRMRSQWAAFRSEYDKAAAEAQLMEQAIKATQIQDNNEGAANLDHWVAPSPHFDQEWGGP